MFPGYREPLELFEIEDEDQYDHTNLGEKNITLIIFQTLSNGI